MLNNKGAERAVLAGLCSHGFNAYIEIVDIVNINLFLDNKNQLIFKVLENLFAKDQKIIDIPSIISEIQVCGYEDQIYKTNIDQEYIRALFNYPIEISNIRIQTELLAKLYIARLAQTNHQKAFKDLELVTGKESIDEIIKLSEAPFLNLMSNLTNSDQIQSVGEDIDEYIDHLIETSGQSVGIYTPFPIFNHIVGDGLRPGVHLIAARAKVGKMQPLDSIVYCWDGPKEMGQIKIGDKILTPFNEVSTITEIEDHGLQDVYTINFTDNTSMECGLDHLIEYTTRKSQYYRVASLRELLNRGIKSADEHLNFRVRITKPVEFKEKGVVIQPYDLGLILNDNTLYKNYINRDFLLFYDIEKWNSRRIPNDYIYNSIKIRKELFKGMMDCSGIVTNTIKEYVTDSVLLAEDMKKLSQSLGASSYIKYDSVLSKYTVCMDFTKQYKSISNVSLNSEQKKCRCIKIQDNRGLYLTNDFTVTHNSTFGKEVGYHVSKNLNIPALYIDTEMQKNDQINRMLASMTKINIRKIEKGLFKDNPLELNKVIEAKNALKGLKFFHKNVSGRDFSYILSVIKRWIYKEVGFDINGKTNPHLVIYDYFKLMDAKALKDAAEHQLLGFQIAAMHDFCQQYNTPVLSFVQTNRDGITKDSSDVVSQSDRLVWNAISLSILRTKTPEEIGVDGIQNGNAKLVPLDGRYMERMDSGDYINLQLNGSIASIKEISTKNKPKNDTGFEIKDGNKQSDQSEYNEDFRSIGDLTI